MVKHMELLGRLFLRIKRTTCSIKKDRTKTCQKVKWEELVEKKYHSWKTAKGAHD